MLKLYLNCAKKKRLGLPVSAWRNAEALPAQQSIADLRENSLTQTFPML